MARDRAEGRCDRASPRTGSDCSSPCQPSDAQTTARLARDTASGGAGLRRRFDEHRPERAIQRIDGRARRDCAGPAPRVDRQLSPDAPSDYGYTSSKASPPLWRQSGGDGPRASSNGDSGPTARPGAEGLLGRGRWARPATSPSSPAWNSAAPATASTATTPSTAAPATTASVAATGNDLAWSAAPSTAAMTGGGDARPDARALGQRQAEGRTSRAPTLGGAGGHERRRRRRRRPPSRSGPAPRRAGRRRRGRLSSRRRSAPRRPDFDPLRDRAPGQPGRRRTTPS